MTDAIAAPEAVPTPASAPVLTSQEIEALIERKAQEISDKRVSGLMSSYDKKFAALQRQLSGDTEPVEDPAIAALKRENAILKAAQRFPKAAPLYQKLLEVEDTEEQIAIMEKWLTPPPEAAPVPPAPEPETPEPSTPVDPNSPPQTLNGGVLPTPAGGVFTDPRYASQFIEQEQAAWEARNRG